jgi:hypothetical protein
MRCLDLIGQTATLVKRQCSVDIVNSAYAPRSFGGWGIPHIVSWLTQESPDDLTSYINTMSSFYEVARDQLLKDKVKERLNTTLDQEMDRVDIATLLTSPRAVRIVGVPNPSGSVLAKIKEGMRARCNSEIFKDALDAGMSHEIREHLTLAIQSMVVSPSSDGFYFILFIFSYLRVPLSTSGELYLILMYWYALNVLQASINVLHWVL